jgi:hypothetical protein
MVTLDQSALLKVLDALKAAEVGDRIRQAAQTIYQALIAAASGSAVRARAEATPYEHRRALEAGLWRGRLAIDGVAHRLAPHPGAGVQVSGAQL